ncbi:MAG: hypothetical protein M1514_04025 [Patescibacteria group bacterium]|nr:hypothetical protein [Patescibacteria group bacterium]
MRYHIAIMNKSWGLTEKILKGQKIIESRWYKNKYQPCNNIFCGDIIYFKNSGEPVTLKAEVEKVLQFENLSPEKVRQILLDYGEKDGIEKKDFEKYLEMFKEKKYCLLIFLKNVEKIEPFQINKKGFGMMSSWLMVEDVDKIKQ